MEGRRADYCGVRRRRGRKRALTKRAAYWGRGLVRERRLLTRPRPRVVMRRMRDGGRARRLGFAAAAAEASQWHKPTGGPSKPRRRGRPTKSGRRVTRFRRGSSQRPGAAAAALRPQICRRQREQARPARQDQGTYQKVARERVPLFAGFSTSTTSSSLYIRRGSEPVWNQTYGESAVDALDAPPARWRGGVGSHRDGRPAVASSPVATS